MPIQPAVLHITIPRGSDHRISLRLVGSDGFAFDLTGYSVRAQIRTYAGSSAVLAEFVATLPDADDGRIELDLSSEISAGIPAPGRIFSEYLRCAWDCEIVSEGGIVTRVAHGEARISPRVTVPLVDPEV